MSDSVYVILHGAFAFFEYDDKILVRLAKTRGHRYQVWIPFGPPVDIDGSGRLVLTGVTGGSESLVDQHRDEMVYLDGTTPASAAKAAAEVVLPRPVSVVTLMGDVLPGTITVTGPKAAHYPKNWGVKWLLEYTKNGNPQLGAHPLNNNTVTIIAGPPGGASSGHQTHAFEDTIGQFVGYSGVWELPPPPGLHIFFDPPGCSPSGGSKNSGNCGC